MPRKPKNINDPIVDPMSLASMNKFTQPLHGDGYVLSLQESHPILKPWVNIHPALELDIDQRLYKFTSELAPLMDEFWDQIRKQNLNQEILFRWHKRRLELLLQKETQENRERIFKDYITALLFERVYSTNIERRKTFIQVQEQDWLDTEKFNEIQRRHFMTRLESDRKFINKLAYNRYESDIKQPNEKKIPEIIKQDQEALNIDNKKLDEMYQIARKSTVKVFTENLTNALSRANDQLISTSSIRQIKMILRSLDAQWASLFKETEDIQRIFVPELKNQTQLLKEVKVENSAQGNAIPESLQYPGHTREIVVAERFTTDLLNSVRSAELQIKKESRHMVIQSYNRHNNLVGTDSVEASSQYTMHKTGDTPDQVGSESPQRQNAKDQIHHLHEQGTYPRLLGQALQGEHSFDVPRGHQEKVLEMELLNKDNDSSKEIDQIENQDINYRKSLDEHQKSVNRILAGHDYAKQQLIAPNPANQITETIDSDEHIVAEVKEVKESPIVSSEKDRKDDS